MVKLDGYGVRCGVERGWLSTTTKIEVALAYASQIAQRRGGGEEAVSVFALQQTALNRGADIRFLSPYEHEEEVRVLA